MRTKCLVILQTLFFGRVLGQIAATLAGPVWLPEAKYWFSGALPYPVLLPAQILLLMFMSLVTYDACRGSGFWHVSRVTTRTVLRNIAYAYFAINVLRYVITMALVPELRWTGHAIPIAFHFVLASYILVLSLPDVERRRAILPKFVA